LESLQESAGIEANHDTLYHLAFVQAEQRRINEAIVSIHQALEHHPISQDAQHLLVLLVSATSKNYAGALEAADEALMHHSSRHGTLSNGVHSNGIYNSDSPTRSTNNLPNRDIHPPTVSEKPGEDIDRKGSLGSLDMGNDLATHKSLPKAPNLKGFPEPPQIQIGEEGQKDTPLRHRDQTVLANRTAAELESELRLRITRNMLLEMVQGREAALLDQQKMLALISKDLAHLGYTQGEIYYACLSISTNKGSFN